MKENLAHGYALRIVYDLEALEVLIRDEVEPLDIGETLDLSDEISEAIESIVTNYAEAKEEYGSWLHAYFLEILDFEFTSGYDGIVRESCAIVTVGGPHAEIVSKGGDGVLVKVYWGGDRSEIWANAPAVAEYLFELAIV